jgi:hypothetical protein
VAFLVAFLVGLLIPALVAPIVGAPTACLITDQEVGGSSPSGRATQTPAPQGLYSVQSPTVAELVCDFWVVSWSGPHRLMFDSVSDRDPP